MKHGGILVMVVVLFITGATSVFADWWIEVPRGGHLSVGASRTGPYSTRAEADVVNQKYFNGEGVITGSGDNTSSSGGSISSDPYYKLGEALGQALRRWLFGDPEEQARKKAEAEIAAQQARELEQQQKAKEAAREKANQEAMELAQKEQQRKAEKAFQETKQGALDRMKGVTNTKFRLKSVNTSGDVRLKGIGDFTAKTVFEQLRSPNEEAPANQGSKKALDQAYTNREETVAGLETGKDEIMRGASAQVFDNPVELKFADINPAVALKDVGKRPEWVKNNPKVKEAEKELANAQQDLATLQAQRDQLDAQRTKLTNERNAIKDADTLSAKEKELKQKEQDYNNKLLEIAKQAEKIDNLAKEKKHVEYEVESSGPPPDASGQTNNQGN